VLNIADNFQGTGAQTSAAESAFLRILVVSEFSVVMCFEGVAFFRADGNAAAAAAASLRVDNDWRGGGRV
jgi:hypothetical protein